MNFKSILKYICLIQLSIGVAHADTASELKAEAQGLQITQTIEMIPIIVDDITVIIPQGTGFAKGELGATTTTLEGVDSDGDGIRDDLERRISTHFSGEENKKIRAYAYMAAKRFQEQIDPNSSDQDIEDSVTDMSYILACYRRANPEGSVSDFENQLSAWAANTNNRLKKFIERQRYIVDNWDQIPKIRCRVY